MKGLITYFAQNRLLGNVLFFGLLILAGFVWTQIGKEEMPEFVSNWVRVTTSYPGAPALEVEKFVTKPLEDELKGVVGIEELATVSSLGVSTLNIFIDDDYPYKDEVAREIKDAVLRAKLPSEVRNFPRIKQFKSAAKAILDVGIYHKDKEFLDYESRKALQEIVLNFENQITLLPEISFVDHSNVLRPEIQIEVDPKLIEKNEISLYEVGDQIRKNQIHQPIGTLRDEFETRVSALNLLEDSESLKNLVLQGNYQGQSISLGKVGSVVDKFARPRSILKINGREGFFLNIRKSISTDILTAHKAVKGFIEQYQKENQDSPIGLVMMDDESYSVRNRLKIVSSNALIGFVLIVGVLFLFLDHKTGFWVAMGIPFSAAITLLVSMLVGYTVNNMTLAGIIIVLGIVVDDAIIIAENISRKKEMGLSPFEACTQGASEVFHPILASILTTCVAFVPLYFFDGFFGKLVAYIPLVVILMLMGSLIESTLILPGHLMFENPKSESKRANWFQKYEKKYERLLIKTFKYRNGVFVAAIGILVASGYLYSSKLKFVMFPREESKEVFIKVKANNEFTRFETAKALAPLEKMFFEDKTNVVASRSRIGLSRRGGEVKQNEASILVELYPAEERSESLNQLLAKWEKSSQKLPGLKSVKYLRGRWGHGSGSAIEVQILENDDDKRSDMAVAISDSLKKLSDLKDVEIETPPIKDELIINIKQSELIRYGVAPAQVLDTLKAAIDGLFLYEIDFGDQKGDVRLSLPSLYRQDTQVLGQVKVKNATGGLTEINKLVEIKKQKRASSIQRRDYKRSTMVYAGLSRNALKTPLEIAQYLEKGVFLDLKRKYPSAQILFKGEIKDSRESRGQFQYSIIMVICTIYLILIVMLKSLGKPLLVLLIVPFGMASVVFTLILHGMSVYGFFAAIGTLGMIGVVINDAIVMIDKIEQSFALSGQRSWKNLIRQCVTRLRPVVLTTLTTVVGVLPTAYGIAGYDSMLAEMMLTMGWGLAFGTLITLVLIPNLYSLTLGTFKSDQSL